MAFGLSHENIEKIREIFARHSEVKRAILYGSRAMGTHRNASDIDLTLTGKDLNFKILASIETELDDLLLPFQFDLSIRRQIQNESLLNHIERVGVVFYEREPDSTGECPADALEEGWEVKRLGEVCEVVNGGTPKTGVDSFWNGPHFWITPAEMGKRLNPFVDETQRTLSDTGLSKCSAQILPPFSVILSSRAPIGHLVINTKPMATNQGCKGLVPKKTLGFKYLYYYLFSQVELLNSLGTGATFKELSGGKLKEVPIPLPPLSEQERIVGILDEAFAGIASAKERTEKNLQNARDLFQSKLNQIFSQRGEGWMEKRLGEVAESISTGPFGSLIHKSDYISDGIPLVNPINITPVGIVPDQRKTVSASVAEKLKAYKLKIGDIVTARRGEIGRTSVVSLEQEGWLCGTGCFFIRFENSFDPIFFSELLQSKPYKDQLVSVSMRATMPSISNKDLMDLVVSYPDIQVQKTLVQEIDGLRKETRRLESIYRRKLEALEALKKSLLHRAFAGAL